MSLDARRSAEPTHPYRVREPRLDLRQFQERIPPNRRSFHVLPGRGADGLAFVEASHGERTAVGDPRHALSLPGITPPQRLPPKEQAAMPA